MANRFVRRARDGGDRNQWADFQHAQDYLGIPVNTPLLYLDGADLKYSKGIVGLDDESDIGSCIFDTILILSVASLTNSLWAKVELSRINTSLTISLTSIAGANDPTTLPASFTGAYDGEKGGYYIQSDRRCLALIWINASGTVEGIVNCLNGATYAGYSTSNDANDNIYQFNYRKYNLLSSMNKDFVAQVGVFTSTYNAEITINNITTAAASFVGTIPAASAWAGKRIKCIKVDSGAGVCTVTPAAGTLQGASAFPLRVYGDFIELESDGTNIWVIDSLSTLDSATLDTALVINTAHGIGVKPRTCTPAMYCVTTDLAFAAGEEVDSWPTYETTGGTERFITISRDATNINIGLDSGVLELDHKTTGVATVITSANWRMRYRLSI